MGLKYNDLRDTIIPQISIDEFEPKGGNDNELIVVAFYAINEDPAKDLDDFVEKGPYDIIDVDVSPNPDEEGRYLIFLEIKRHDDFWFKLDAIIDDIEKLTGKQTWRVSTTNLDYNTQFDDTVLRDVVITNPVEYQEQNPSDDELEDAEVPEAALESFLQDSTLLTFEKKDSILTLASQLHSITLEVVGYGNTDTLIESQGLTGMSMLDNPYEVRKLRLMLGEGWEVFKMKDTIAVTSAASDNLLVVRYIE